MNKNLLLLITISDCAEKVSMVQHLLCICTHKFFCSTKYEPGMQDLIYVYNLTDIPNFMYLQILRIFPLYHPYLTG